MYVVLCDKCDQIEHRNAIDILCDYIINSCINASVLSMTRSQATHVTGWTDHGNLRGNDHFCDTGSGLSQVNRIIIIFRRSSRCVRCCRRDELSIKLIADNVSNGTEFWKEVKNINTSTEIKL